MAEGARLESVYTGNRIGGSNPSLSAILAFLVRHWHFLYRLVFPTTGIASAKTKWPSAGNKED